jgi:hypothetical protein
MATEEVKAKVYQEFEGELESRGQQATHSRDLESKPFWRQSCEHHFFSGV